MALNAAINQRLECPYLLLYNLVHSVNFLLDISVFRQSSFYYFSSLRHLQSRVKVILRHGCRIKHHLIYSQESYAAFDVWLEKSLTDHSLRLQLTETRKKVLHLYHDWAFIKNEDLFQSFISCLSALSTRDYNLIPLPPSNLPIHPIGDPKIDMPLNGNPVLYNDGDEEVDALETKFLPEKKLSTTDRRKGIEIPAKSSSNIRKTVMYVTQEAEKEDAVNVNVPEFSYILEASPVTTAPDFSGIKSSSRQSNTLESSYRSNHGKFKSIDITTPSSGTKSFLESGGLVAPDTLGFFPLPSKGQTLTSFLTSLSNNMPELDRENAHFNVSEALISAFERLKVKEKTEKMKEMKRVAQNEAMFESPYVHHSSRRRRLEQIRLARQRQRSFVNTETEESELEYQKPRRPPPVHIRKRHRYTNKLGSDGRSESFISTTEIITSPSSLSSEGDNDEDEDEFISSFSAENVALNLLRNSKIKNVQLSDASELQWLVSESQAPQNLLPLPKNWNTSASESESDFSCGALDKSMRLRGTSDWAPPRPQIIFTIHSPPNLHNLLGIQKYRCAGCGMKVERQYASTFRYCNYLGKFFCTGCHTKKQARLPQMIIHKWDFSPYLVSNFSATLLESLQSDPLYNVLAINPNLMRKVRLNNFRNYRIQLGYLVQYIRNCKAAVSLCEELKAFPTYYTADVDLYSLQDLVDLRFSIGLPLKTKEFVSKAVYHVLHCELCKQLGFLCEGCKTDEVIFPFQLNRVVRCGKCMSCFHLKCFNPGRTTCPKCIRLTVRSNRNDRVAIV